MDINREHEDQTLREELNGLFADGVEVEKIRENARKAAELAEFCGLTGMIALRDWTKNPKAASALAVGVELLARGKDLDIFAMKLSAVADRTEGKEKEA